MKTSFTKYAGSALLASCLVAQAPLAQAVMVSTQEAVSTQQAQLDREKVRSFLDLEVSMEQFESSWAKGGHWGVVVLPPTRLPATPDEAKIAAQRAVSLGGPRRAQYQETLKEVGGILP